VIFVSYSHADTKWLKRFMTIAKPLESYAKITCWSDKNIQPGKWEPQIQEAMRKASVALLLVSDEFLASDYIMTKEVPYLLEAHANNKLLVLWVYLAPCLIETTEISTFQAITINGLKALISMGEWEWKETFCKACRTIDDRIKIRETPSINSALTGKGVERKETHFNVLAKQASREVEVLVYGGDKLWYRQAPVKPGSRATTCYFGNEKSKKGSEYRVIALTTATPLKHGGKYSNLPGYRTCSSEITVKRS
jgi:hypothetical protein